MNESNERLTYLFNRYFEKTATEQEAEELFQLIKSSADDKQLTALIKQAWDNMQIKGPLFTSDKSDEMLNRILYAGTPETKIVKIQKRFPWKKYAAVAAMLVLTSMGLYFGLKKREAPRLQVNKFHDIMPGTNKAVLTLANGTKIQLDSTHTGVLTKQGNSSISNTSDQRLVYAANNSSEETIPQINILSTPKGGQYQVVLPDGSKVWLNAASSIKYPPFFTGKDRRVEITGEAYFEVAKNRSMPFIVKAKSTEIEVLGTHFNIMAYDDVHTMRTTLLEGSVKITRGAWSATLKPGQQAQLDEQNGLNIIKDIDTEEAVAWKNGLFQFTDDDIRSIMQRVSRWYNVDVIYKGKIPVKQYSGRIPRNVKLSELLNMLKYTGVNTRTEGKIIYVIN